DSLIALFAAILPTCPAVLYFEMFFDGRLHVIIAVAVVFDWHAGGVEFPGSDDVIAAAAIVIGIFSAHRTVRLTFHGLRAGWVALNENLVGAFSPSYMLKRWRPSQQLGRRQYKCDDCGADDKCRELTATPVWDDFSGRNVLRSLHPLRSHLKIPRNEHRHCK